jgi:hypothetical protein
MADYTLALEWSDNEDFSSSTTATWSVLVATPYRVPVEGTRIVWARRGVNTTEFDRMITVTFDHFGVAGDGPYDQQFGDLLTLETAIFAPYLRIIPTGTSMPRVNGGSDFWPTFLGTGVPVTRESYSPSSSPDAGADTATVTFRAVEPNT